VHVPFCVVKCGYCDFNSYTVDDASVLDVFLGALELELQRAALPAPPSVFIGGGTPTYLDEARFQRMLELLGAAVELAAVPEVTIEANPESVTLAKLRAARAAGIGRISIGAQSFDPARLRFLERAHGAAAIRTAVATARQAGFDNVSLDLMFGLPGQTLAQWRGDLAQALELEPDHLSCYNLTFEAGTALERARRLGEVQPNDAAVDREMFLYTRERLAEAGFAAYEISNFAGRGGPCRHNDHYWLQGDYVGVGPGAASHRRGVRSTNLKALEAWAHAVCRGLPAAAEAETLRPRQRAAEALWLGLRRTDGVDLDALRARDAMAAPAIAALAPVIEALVAEGLAQRSGARIALTEEGLLFADEVGARLLTT
jgi:oxygen-independent coproporphyrinogen-3 oxidase